jgi:hypothetical protein
MSTEINLKKMEAHAYLAIHRFEVISNTQAISKIAKICFTGVPRYTMQSKGQYLRKSFTPQ